MGQFKPMVKMMTTEPSVMLKLKSGGSATHKRMMKEGGEMGYKPMGKAIGGAMGALAGSPPPTTPMGNPAAARAMATRRMAKMPAPAAASVPKVGPAPAPAMPMGRPMMRKKGGEVESKSMHKAEMAEMKGIKKELKSHEDKPASKAHKGLKTGGIAKSCAPGEYATGGVVDGQGGYKNGGIIKTMTKKTTKVVEAKPDRNSAPTGNVKMGNAGGYKKGGEAKKDSDVDLGYFNTVGRDGAPGGGKKGGAIKKHFATGGVVDSGRPVAMPKKAPSRPVAISQLSGTFKKGGKVAC